MKYVFYLLTLVIVFNNIITAQTVIDSTEVSTGWNIIGALSSGATLDIISTEPPGIITSSFFGYEPGGGYNQADTLNRGNGYWVKVSQDGKVIFMVISSCGNVEYSGKTYTTTIIGSQVLVG